MSYIQSQGYNMLSVTTDGYITNFPEDRLKELLMLETSKLYSKARFDISGNGNIIEVKKSANQILSLKKRGQIELDSKPDLDDSWLHTINDDSDDDRVDDDIILAKAGIRPPRELKSKLDIRDWFVEKHLQRVYKCKIERTKLSTATYMRKHDNEDFHEIISPAVS